MDIDVDVDVDVGAGAGVDADVDVNVDMGVNVDVDVDVDIGRWVDVDVNRAGRSEMGRDGVRWGNMGWDRMGWGGTGFTSFFSLVTLTVASKGRPTTAPDAHRIPQPKPARSLCRSNGSPIMKSAISGSVPPDVGSTPAGSAGDNLAFARLLASMVAVSAVGGVVMLAAAPATGVVAGVLAGEAVVAEVTTSEVDGAHPIEITISEVAAS